jgi:hypothetical protein
MSEPQLHKYAPFVYKLILRVFSCFHCIVRFFGWDKLENNSLPEEPTNQSHE